LTQIPEQRTHPFDLWTLGQLRLKSAMTGFSRWTSGPFLKLNEAALDPRALGKPVDLRGAASKSRAAY